MDTVPNDYILINDTNSNYLLADDIDGNQISAGRLYVDVDSSATPKTTQDSKPWKYSLKASKVPPPLPPKSRDTSR